VFLVYMKNAKKLLILCDSGRKVHSPGLVEAILFLPYGQVEFWSKI